jgi:DNA-binding transcriptional regulator WhiA
MILRLRESGYTLQQIGAALDPPCSYQAVAEVLRKEKKTSANHLCAASNGA